MKKLYLTLLLSILLIALFPSSVFAQNIDPQYVFVRKDPMGCSPAPVGCSYLWNGQNPENINLNAINDIFNKIGTKGTNSRKVGIGVLFYYNFFPRENLKISLQRLLDYSLIHDFPVYIVLDGFQWWDARPDLWNWWDPSAPGYNPDNKNNVEWTCWDSSCAIKKSWRNWGAEMEVKPHPNIASSALIETNKASLMELVPIIVNWFNGLPPEKKYLFGGLSAFLEQDIGVNYYYYRNGIPTSGGLNDAVQLGYAAVKTSGIKSSGQITSADLNEVVKRYQTALDKTIFELGIPRNKIYNHNGGEGFSPFSYYPFPYNTSDAALNNYAQPGWSFYATSADNPQNLPSLNSSLNQIENGEWAAPEWLTWASDYNGWISALRNTLNYRNNRLVNIANWEGMVRDKQYVLDAIRTVVNESPSCWVTSPVLNNPTISGGNVTLSWQNGQNNVATYLNASTIGDFNPSGTLKNMNVINTGATGKTTYNLSNLSPGKYYWAVVSDGCSPVQRKIANGKFEITSPPTPTPVPPTSTPIPPTSTPIPPSPTLTPTPLPGDLNHDNKVDILDYNILLQNFGNTTCGNVADIDGNCKVDIFDYNILVGNFGK